MRVNIQLNFTFYQNFIPSEDLIEEREKEQIVQERQAWEQQCGQLHGEVAKLTDMCNNLLKDQQALISALIGRTNLPGGPQTNGKILLMK